MCSQCGITFYLTVITDTYAARRKQSEDKNFLNELENSI